MFLSVCAAFLAELSKDLTRLINSLSSWRKTNKLSCPFAKESFTLLSSVCEYANYFADLSVVEHNSEKFDAASLEITKMLGRVNQRQTKDLAQNTSNHELESIVINDMQAIANTVQVKTIRFSPSLLMSNCCFNVLLLYSKYTDFVWNTRAIF